MKTTLDIDDRLLRAAKKRAVEEGGTLTPREEVEALRRVLSSPSLTILFPGPSYPQLLFEAVPNSR